MQKRLFHGHPGQLSWLISLLVASFAPAVQAQIIPDNTLGTGRNSITTTVGNRTDITGGLQRNSSLFHSFEQFNINTNQQVYFANPALVRNIFSRVTGGSLSSIDGLLGVAGPANLFLINPNGIIFGPNARLDISGSFFATTADALMFPDGQRFAATGDRAVPLVEVNIPIGLQMGANPPAMITNRGILATGQNLTLAAGNLDLQGQLRAGGNLTLNATDTVKIRDTVTEPFVARSTGDMTIQGNEGIDILALNHPEITSFVSGGNLSLISDGIVSGDAHFASGGNFSIRTLTGSPGNFVSFYDPIIQSTGDVEFGGYSGASLKVEAGGSIRATGNIAITRPECIAGTNGCVGGISATDGDAAIMTGGRALILRAGIPITANFNFPSTQPDNPTNFAPPPQPITPQGSITVAGGISTSGNSSTTADPVFLRATGPINVNGVLGNASIFAGSIEINTPSTVNIAGNLFVRRDVLEKAGDITIGNLVQPSSITIGGAISTRNLLDTLPAGFTRSTTNPDSNPDGGNITIRTQGDLRILGAFDTNTGLSTPVNSSSNPDNVVSLASAARNGKSGDISIIAGQVIDLAAGIASGSNFDGKGGVVSLEGSAINTQKGIITSRNDGTVIINPSIPNSQASFVARPGIGGDVALNATTGDVQTGSIIASSNGQGGYSNIFITSRQGSVFANGVTLSTSNTDTGQPTGTVTGTAGNIEINAPGQVSITNGSSLQSVGSAGYIFIGNSTTSTPIRPATVTIDQSSLVATNNSNTSSNTGGGWIQIAAQGNSSTPGEKINLSSANLRTTASNNANGGRINLSVDPQGEINLDNTLIDSSISGTGQKGSGVTIGANGGSLTLDNNSLITTASTGTAPSAEAGSIAIDAATVSLDHSSSLNATTAGAAAGGNIAINNARQVTISGSSLVNTAVQQDATGDGGSISINTGMLDLNTGGRIQSRTLGAGKAGNVQLSFTDTATLAGFDPNSLLYSGILTDTQGTGRGGDITINSPTNRVGNLTLSGGGFLSAQTTSAAAGGDIAINVSNLSLLDGGQVLTTSSGTGTAGSITVNPTGNVTISGQRAPLGDPSSFFSNGTVAPNNLNPLGFITTANSQVENSGLAGFSYVTLQRNPAGNPPPSTIQVTDTAGTQTLATLTNNSTVDYYAFTVTKDGSRGIFGIANASVPAANAVDTMLFLYDRRTGRLLASNDDFYPIQPGSASGLDARLAYNFNYAGEYVIAVARYSSSAANNTPVSLSPNFPGLQPNSSYRLNLTLQNQGATYTQVSLNPNQGLSSGLFAQSTVAGGKAGSITVQGSGTTQLTLDQGAAISAANVAGSSTDINLQGLRTLQVTNSLISASTTASPTGTGGVAGSITVNATDGVVLGGTYQSAPAGLAAQATGKGGIAGDIAITTPQLTVQNGAAIAASSDSGPSGGDINLSLNTLQLNNGRIAAETQTGGAGSVTVNATRGATLENNSLLSVAATSAAGRAGDITVTTPQLTLQTGAAIAASSISALSGGDITLRSDTVQLNNARITAETQTGGAGTVGITASQAAILDNNSRLSVTATGSGGQAGDITVTTPQLTIQNGAEIAASSTSGLAGGDIGLQVTTLQLDNGQVRAETQTGVAGSVTVNATSGTALNNNSRLSVAATGTRGRAGNLLVTTPQLTVQMGAELVASSDSGASGGNIGLRLNTLQLNNGQVRAETQTGVAGSVIVNATNSTLLDNHSRLSVTATGAGGRAGDIVVTTPQLTIQNGAAIAASSDSGASGGNIGLRLNTLQLNNGQVRAETQTGVAGSVAVEATAGTLLDNNSRLSVAAIGPGGRAGNILVTTPQLTVQRGAEIAASSDSGLSGGEIGLRLNTLRLDNGQVKAETQTGVAGSVTVNATNQTSLDNNSLLSVAATGTDGTAGNLAINTGKLSVNRGSRVTVSSPAGQAGNLTVTTHDLRLNQGTLDATTGGGSGGANIKLTVGPDGALWMRYGSLISANANNQANGGNITINAPFIFGLTFENSDIVANAVQGQGGKINITTNAIFGLQFRPKQTPLSDITASSDFGVSGSVVLKTIDTDVTRGLSTPAIVFTDVSRLTTSACEAVGAKAATNSELRIYGRGGIPLSPTAPLPAQTASSDWVSLDVSPEIPTTVTFPNGKQVMLDVGQTYQLQATCVKSWQNQQRPTL